MCCENDSTAGIVEVIRTAHTKTDLNKTRALIGKIAFAHLYFFDDNTLNHYKLMFHDELPERAVKKLWFGKYP